ncbi:histidine phosphatase family protein [Oxalobacteraceae bacterium R-40]|uniref:Histidine phosphatase family protein n=1 Tax=Keguizhuia sedimenti TaxID=3064264 RepID=A0ABU1BNU0_9BURK|nr:histidine phosphatase family protein [Oxalobacteraceae bacterium R-40]
MIAHSRRRLYLMRHGSVTYFDEDGKPHIPDLVSLDESGCLQATAAGRIFAEHNISFDRVIVSDLPRTRETALRVLAETGQRLSPEEWPELREIKGGDLEKIRDDELKDAFLGAFDGVVSEHKRFLAGESVGELMDRVYPCLNKLLSDDSWDTALMVLHGGVNRAILSHALTGQRMFLGHLGQAAGCINVLDVGRNESDWVVRVINYAPLSSLQSDSRHTMMEIYFSQYKKSRGL